MTNGYDIIFLPEKKEIFVKRANDPAVFWLSQDPGVLEYDSWWLLDIRSASDLRKYIFYPMNLVSFIEIHFWTFA